MPTGPTIGSRASGIAGLGGAPPPSTPYHSDQSLDPLENAKKGYNWLSSKASDVWKAVGPQAPDLSGVKTAQNNAFGLENNLGNERMWFHGNYNPFAEQDIRNRQTGGLDMLAAAAAGRVPSPAELQLQQQAARNAAGSYGQAAALQGRSPGMALRTGMMGATATQAGANADAAILRAKETADARQAYMNALSGVRTGDQNLLGSDLDWRKALLQGQVGALGAGTTAAGNEATAQTNAAGSRNSFMGSLLGGGGALLAAL